MKNNTINQINFHLYHYAGNNPVKFTDPTGAFEIDEENKSITFDYTDNKDLKSAQKEFSKNKDVNSCIAKNPKNGSSVTFNSRNALKDFIKSDGFNKLESIVSFGGDLFGAASIAEITKLVGNIGNSFSVAGAMVDGVRTIDNLNDRNYLSAIDKAADVAIDLTGLAGPLGASISIELKYTKKGFSFASSSLAQYSLYLEKKIINSISAYYFGENVK